MALLTVMSGERAIVDLANDPPALYAESAAGRIEFSVRAGDLVQLENSVHETEDFEVAEVVEKGIRVQPAAGVGGIQLVPREQVTVTSGMAMRKFVVHKVDGADVLVPHWAEVEVRT